MIVWREAAIADFILKHNIGIAVDSLYDVDNAIKTIKECDYELMRKNAISIGEKLRAGYYTKKALSKAV